MLDDIPYPRVPRRLPTILTVDEVTRLIDAARTLTDRTMLMVLYSTGMRNAEMRSLHVKDIDSRAMLIHIQRGKGGRDRYVPLSPTLLETLRAYWRWMKPKTWLFPGTITGWRADKPITPKVVWDASRACDTGTSSSRKTPEARAAVYRNRRRIRGARGLRLLRLRGERLERPFAHLYETGGMRRFHLRGHTNIQKRLLIHGRLQSRITHAATDWRRDSARAAGAAHRRHGDASGADSSALGARDASSMPRTTCLYAAMALGTRAVWVLFFLSAMASFCSLGSAQSSSCRPRKRKRLLKHKGRR